MLYYIRLKKISYIMYNNFHQIRSMKNSGSHCDAKFLNFQKLWYCDQHNSTTQHIFQGYFITLDSAVVDGASEQDFIPNSNDFKNGTCPKPTHKFMHTDFWCKSPHLDLMYGYVFDDLMIWFLGFKNPPLADGLLTGPSRSIYQNSDSSV